MSYSREDWRVITGAAEPQPLRRAAGVVSILLAISLAASIVRGHMDLSFAALFVAITVLGWLFIPAQTHLTLALHYTIGVQSDPQLLAEYRQHVRSRATVFRWRYLTAVLLFAIAMVVYPVHTG